MTEMPNHRNVYISLATSMSKTGKFQLTPLVCTGATTGGRSSRPPNFDKRGLKEGTCQQS